MQVQKIQDYLNQNQVSLPVTPCGCTVRVGPWTIDQSLNGDVFELLVADNDQYHLVETSDTVEGILDVIISRGRNEARMEQS